MRWPAAAATLLVLVAGAPAASAAAPGTLTGTLTGAKLPAAGKGAVPVRLMRLSDGRVTAAGFATPGGRFTLRTAAGGYALLAAVVPFHGSKAGVERVAALAKARAGKRVRLKPTLKKRRAVKRKAKRRTGAGARAAFVSVDYPALWVKEFTTESGDPDARVLTRGMDDMIIGDLQMPITRCNAVIVERARLNDVIAEIERQQSASFDPVGRVQRGRLIAHNATVTGSLALSGTTLTLTATYQDLRTGRSKTVSASGPQDQFFDTVQRLGRQLVDAVCPHTPRTYAGTFSGTATSAFNSYTLTWTGSAVIQLTSEHGLPPQGWPDGDYAHYSVLSGTAHVKLDGTRGTCVAHGEADIALAPGIASGEDAVQLVDKPYYRIMIATRGDESVPYTETGTSCQTDAAYPLTGIQFAFTPSPLQSNDAVLTASTTMDTTFGRQTSSFSFAPAS
jgi:hypothetical protein